MTEDQLKKGYAKAQEIVDVDNALKGFENERATLYIRGDKNGQHNTFDLPLDSEFINILKYAVVGFLKDKKSRLENEFKEI